MWEVLGFSLLQGTHVAEDIFFARSPTKIYPPAWTVDVINHWTNTPVSIQRSWPRRQYSYWADRSWSFKSWLPTRLCWLMFSRAFKNFQQRSMIWVPDLHLITFLEPGTLWRCISTYLGAIQRNFVPTFTRFFLCTTRSCRTSGTLSL